MQHATLAPHSDVNHVALANIVLGVESRGKKEKAANLEAVRAQNPELCLRHKGEKEWGKGGLQLCVRALPYFFFVLLFPAFLFAFAAF